MSPLARTRSVRRTVGRKSLLLAGFNDHRVDVRCRLPQVFILRHTRKSPMARVLHRQKALARRHGQTPYDSYASHHRHLARGRKPNINRGESASDRSGADPPVIGSVDIIRHYGNKNIAIIRLARKRPTCSTFITSQI